MGQKPVLGAGAEAGVAPFQGEGDEAGGDTSGGDMGAPCGESGAEANGGVGAIEPEPGPYRALTAGAMETKMSITAITPAIHCVWPIVPAIVTDNFAIAPRLTFRKLRVFANRISNNRKGCH